MAVTCDNCGKIIGEDDFVSFATDHTENKVGGCSADDWFYFHEGECAKTARGILESLRRFSHEGESSGLRWMLVDSVDEGRSAPACNPEPQAQPRKAPVRPSSERGIYDRLKTYLSGPRRPNGIELRERREAGTPLQGIITYKPSRGYLLKSNLVTLEDVAELSEVEFMGIEGVGVKLLERVKAAMVLHSLGFCDGPTLEQLSGTLRELRQEHGFDRPEDLASDIARDLGIPDEMENHLGNMEEPHAMSELRASMRDCERPSKAQPPGILAAVASHYEMGTAEILDRAKSYEGVAP